MRTTIVNNKFIILFFLAFLLVLQSCELYTIGGRTIRLPDINQLSPEGAVLMLKAELERENILGATRLFASPKGKHLLAEERELLKFDVIRYQNLYGTRKLTNITEQKKPETQTTIVVAELDFYKNLQVTTININGLWYIAEVQEL